MVRCSQGHISELIYNRNRFFLNYQNIQSSREKDSHDWHTGERGNQGGFLERKEGGGHGGKALVGENWGGARGKGGEEKLEM